MRDAELPEERVARRPIVRRIRFWGTLGLAALAVSGVSVTWLAERYSSASPVDTPVSRGGSETGWGPEREVYTIQSPAPIAVFNSITDNPNFGDERNFVGVKDAAIEGPGYWLDELAVYPGQRIRMRIYYENSAADNFGDSAPSWLQDARVAIWTSAQPDYRIGLWAELSASNAAVIWDGATVISEMPVRLVPVKDSAELEDNAHAGSSERLSIDELLDSEGALIGDEKGNVLPGYEYSGYVTIEFDVIGL